MEVCCRRLLRTRLLLHFLVPCFLVCLAESFKLWNWPRSKFPTSLGDTDITSAALPRPAIFPCHPDFARNFEQRLQKEQLDSRPKYHQNQNYDSAARTHQHHPPAQYHPPSQYNPPAQYQYKHPNTPIVGGPGLNGVPTMEGFMEGFQTEGWISGK